MGEFSSAFARLLEVLNRLEIPYEVGGSVASSAHGITRTTLDVDLVVDLKADKIDAFASDLQPEFYADAPLIREAFARGRAANLIHFRTARKFDLFPLREDGSTAGRNSDAALFVESVRMGVEAIECAVASAEDTILRKLEWYRAGGEVSQRQWDDVLGISKVAGRRLDLVYLRQWAGYLKVDDLLEKLVAESGLGAQR